jgi:CBS domain-containing protein
MGKLKVSDLMTERVFSIRANEDLARLNDLMMDLHVRHVPVVDNEKNVIGLVSHRDLIRVAISVDGLLPVAEQRELLKNTTVQEIMTVGIETVEPNQDIEEAGRIMLENKLGCLPVTENNTLVGILTEADFVKFLVDREPS